MKQKINTLIEKYKDELRESRTKDYRSSKDRIIENQIIEFISDLEGLLK